MTQDPLLVIEDLTFRYQSREEPAIVNISFELRPGEVLLVAGSSGCGKTTLARCINGLIPRSYRGELSGSVRLRGQEVKKMALADVSQEVGTLLQDPERQIVSSSVEGEVAFGPENLGLPKVEIAERLDEVFSRMGIEHLRSRETFALSGGEKQKVALAGLLAMHPSILLLDEPLASLDPASAYEALEIFRHLADEGAAILLIEHRVEDALSVRPKRMLYISEGRTKYLGPVDELPSVIDHREVKLPAPWVIKRIHEIDEPISVPPLVPPADGKSLVFFKGVSFAYNDGPMVLHDINLEIRQGDMIAVLGHNGAGKSTLVKHIIGLLKPDQGRVLLEGVDTRKLSVARAARTVGYVFQSPSHMLFAPTVREELAFGPQNLGYSPEEIANYINESVKAVNLVGLENYSPLGLSFGQKKRTTIGAIAAMRSRILIMDEPTAGQDYANYRRFMDAFCNATTEGGESILAANFDVTLFITHDLDLAVTYANRVILINDGRVVVDGPPEEVLRDFDRLERCRVRPTSLLRLNYELLNQTKRFMPAEGLAAYTSV